jgi:hypothetical protein
MCDADMMTSSSHFDVTIFEERPPVIGHTKFKEISSSDLGRVHISDL